MAAIQWVTVSVSNNFFIYQRILPRFSMDFGFTLLCTFLEVDLLFFSRATSLEIRYLDRWVFRILYVTDSRNVNNVVYAMPCSESRDHVHLWITFVFVSNTCVSLDITKTSQDHATICIPCLLHHSTYVVIFRSVWTPEHASC
jgi:hypothetical protein